MALYDFKLLNSYQNIKRGQKIIWQAYQFNTLYIKDGDLIQTHTFNIANLNHKVNPTNH